MLLSYDFNDRYIGFKLVYYWCKTVWIKSFHLVLALQQVLKVSIIATLSVLFGWCCSTGFCRIIFLLICCGYPHQTQCLLYGYIFYQLVINAHIGEEQIHYFFLTYCIVRKIEYRVESLKKATRANRYSQFLNSKFLVLF